MQVRPASTPSRKHPASTRPASTPYPPYVVALPGKSVSLQRHVVDVIVLDARGGLDLDQVPHPFLQALPQDVDPRIGAVRGARSRLEDCRRILGDSFPRGPDGRIDFVVLFDNLHPAVEALLRQEPHLVTTVVTVLQGRRNFRLQVRPVTVEPLNLGALESPEVLRFRDDLIVFHWMSTSIFKNGFRFFCLSEFMLSGNLRFFEAGCVINSF